MRRAVIVTLLLAGLAPAVPAAGEKESRLQGTARISRTKNVVGAAVVVRRESDPGKVWLTSTGNGGTFFIDGLSDGDYTVRISREGYAPEVKDKVVLKFPFRAVVEVTMEPGQADLGASGTQAADGSGPLDVHGTVRDTEGYGIGEAWVRLVRQDGSADPVGMRTPAEGRFSFDGLAPGEWRVEVLGIGYLPLRQRLMLGGETELVVQLVKQPTDYVPSPLDLQPPEVPVIPEGFSR